MGVSMGHSACAIVPCVKRVPDLHGRILDNLPVAMVKMRKDDRQANSLIKTYERGFPVGFKASLEVRCS